MQVVDNSGKDLMPRWFAAPSKQYNTSERLKLDSDTKRIFEKGDAKKIQELKKAILDEVNTHSSNDIEQLASWIADNTLYDGNKCQGPGESLFLLFRKIIKTEGEQKAFNDIEQEVQRKLNEKAGFRFEDLPLETKKEILVKVNVKDLYSVTVNRKLTELINEQKKDIYIGQLNNGLIDCYDIIQNVDALIDLFGKNCSRILRLDLLKMSDITDEDIIKISENFPNISCLLLKNAVITDKSAPFLKKMTNLTSLSLSRCRSINKFSFLRKLNKLTCFDISECTQIVNAAFLGALTNLKSLNVSGCINIVSFNPLGKLINLIDLDISENQIQSAVFLNTLINIKSLNIAGCDKIQFFNFLENLTNLRSLDLSGCIKFKDAISLSKLKNLTSLNFTGCKQITNAGFLGFFTNLKSLNLSGCVKNKNFSFLSILTTLESLDLSGCSQITDKDTAVLKKLINLAVLKIARCTQINDGSFLEDMTNLKILDVTGCRFESPKVLEFLESEVPL